MISPMDNQVKAQLLSNASKAILVFTPGRSSLALSLDKFTTAMLWVFMFFHFTFVTLVTIPLWKFARITPTPSSRFR